MTASFRGETKKREFRDAGQRREGLLLLMMKKNDPTEGKNQAIWPSK